jgi:hypothetical protein
MIANDFRRIALAQGLLPEHPGRDSAADFACTSAEPVRADGVPAHPAPLDDTPAISAERERPA